MPRAPNSSRLGHFPPEGTSGPTLGHTANRRQPERPLCANGNIRGPVNVPLATTLVGIDLSTVNCSSTATNPANDAEGLIEGFAVIAPLGSTL